MMVTPRIAGRTALVIGYGHLGMGAVRAAKKLGLEVIVLSRTGRGEGPADQVLPSSAIDEVLPRADFVVVAAPLTADTRRLLDRRRIGLLKNGAGVVNIARSAIVDYDALRERLERGELSGAVLDVFDAEPVPPESPLWNVPNLLVTPHISCDVPDYIDHLFDFWFGNFGRFLRGEALLNRVDATRGY